MLEYFKTLVKKGNLDGVSMSVGKNGVTFYMYKGDYETSHTYVYDTLDNMYNVDFAVKSELEQMAIDICRLADSKGGKNGNSTT